MTKVVIVTGVSRGIGNSTVEALLKDSDVAVFGIARSEEGLKTLKNKYGDRFDYVAGSVTSENDLQELVNKAIAKYGRIDSVIANAAVADTLSIAEGDISKWQYIFNTNFFSVVKLVQLTLHEVEKTHGNYILVSSLASAVPIKLLSAYGATKAALNSFAASIALENKDVKVIAVGPGIADSSMYQEVYDSYKRQNAVEEMKIFGQLTKAGLKSTKFPGRVFAEIALNGIDNELNGKYYEYDNPLLAKYSHLLEDQGELKQ